MIKKLVFVVVCVVLYNKQPALCEDWLQVPSEVQISTTISDGTYTIDQILSVAREHNIKAVVITDRDLMRWEYGFWPIRNILKKSVEQKSVLQYGAARYLGDIEAAQKASNGILVIPGIESAPFYYWQGSIFNHDLSIHNWHKHMLVFGFKDACDFLSIPVIGNRPGLQKAAGLHTIWYWFLPALLCGIGLLCIVHKQFVGFVCIAAGVVFLINNYPFRDFLFDQYKADQGVAPYQNLIAYVQQHNGLSFWAHPEANNSDRIKGIRIETRAYSEDLLRTDGYTGFCIFYEGYNTIGVPGGIWDEILQEYCRGARKSPVWAIGGLGFDTSGDLGMLMDDLRNVCLVKEIDRDAIVDAFKNGRVYVLRGARSSDFILEQFRVYDTASDKQAIMGQALSGITKPAIQIKARFLDAKDERVRIKIIRNGKIIECFESAVPFDIMYEDKEIAPAEEGRYYRIEIESDKLQCVTNPIFVD